MLASCAAAPAAGRPGARTSPTAPRAASARWSGATASRSTICAWPIPKRARPRSRRSRSDMWGNMARLAAEYVFLDELFDFDPDSRDAGRIEVVGERALRADRRARSGRTSSSPAISAISSCCRSPAPTFGMKVTALFRPPNNPYIADYILSTRHSTMGELLASRAGAAFALAAHPREAAAMIGVLVDQKFTRRPADDVLRPRPARPIRCVPKLARHFDCDVYPARCIRLPGNRFRLEIEDKLDLPRDADGGIDIQATDAAAQRRRRALGARRSRPVDVVPQALGAERQRHRQRRTSVQRAATGAKFGGRQDSSSPTAELAAVIVHHRVRASAKNSQRSTSMPVHVRQRRRASATRDRRRHGASRSAPAARAAGLPARRRQAQATARQAWPHACAQP